MDLPMRAFCLIGNDEKIELTINEIIGFPEETSIAGGYDFKGDLYISIGSYEVHCNGNFYSSTGILYRLLLSLLNCYNSLKGTASYKHPYEDNLEFTLTMTKHGHAVIEGSFQEYPHLSNKFVFEMETNQTCILNTISDLKKVVEVFGDNNEKNQSYSI